jgi:hypothetical protein
MLRSIDSGDHRATVRFTFEGRIIEARQGDTVAAALLAAGVGPFRDSAVSGAPRAPYCMMGVCFECLVVVNGVSHYQACMVKVAPDMTVSRPEPLGGDGHGD